MMAATTAGAQRPEPTAMPIAPTIQRKAAVVNPRTTYPDFIITPVLRSVLPTTI
jgi:hypothetical protein